MKTVILTGASGFLGRHISRYFSKKGWRVVGVDSGAEENAPTESTGKYWTMRLPDDRIDQILETEKPQAVVHTAGRASVPLSVTHPERDFDGNTVLTFKILDAIRRHSPSSRFVHLSSAAVYGNPRSLPIREEASISPISPYGFHKYQAETACREFSTVFGIPTCSLRIFSAYGPGLQRQVLWDILCRANRESDLTLFGTGDESRDFIHAKDIAKAVETVTTSAPMNGETYNVGSGSETPIATLAQTLLTSLGIDRTLKFDGKSQSGVPSRWVADISRLRNLGFRPSIEFTDGIREYVTWAAPLI